MHFWPVEREGCDGVLGEFAGLARGVVGEEDEPAGVDLFEEDEAGGGDGRGCCGGEGHRFWFVDDALGFGEPELELGDWGGGYGGGGEGSASVVLAVREHANFGVGVGVGGLDDGVHVESAAGNVDN